MVATSRRQQQSLVEMRFEVCREGNVAPNGRCEGQKKSR
jgi:hypothetical protein